MECAECLCWRKLRFEPWNPGLPVSRPVQSTTCQTSCVLPKTNFKTVALIALPRFRKTGVRYHRDTPASEGERPAQPGPTSVLRVRARRAPRTSTRGLREHVGDARRGEPIALLSAPAPRRRAPGSPGCTTHIRCAPARVTGRSPSPPRSHPRAADRSTACRADRARQAVLGGLEQIGGVELAAPAESIARRVGMERARPGLRCLDAHHLGAEPRDRQAGSCPARKTSRRYARPGAGRAVASNAGSAVD